MTALVDLTGSMVNGITVVMRAGNQAGKPAWKCVCRCGAPFTTNSGPLRRGKAAGCAQCAKAARIGFATKHGDLGSPEYVSYSAMKGRCGNPSDQRYSRYGGRGIKVCERWLDSYANFLEDMGRKPTRKHTLERIDLNGNYEPANCVWATLSEQANNRSNNTRIEISGRTQTMTQWARESGVNRTVILRRMKRGLSGPALIEKANQEAKNEHR